MNDFDDPTRRLASILHDRAATTVAGAAATASDEAARLVDGAMAAHLAAADPHPQYVLATRQITINGVAYDLTADRSWTVSGEVADGDKGDIVVSSTGAVWTIDNGAVTTAKLGGDITTAGKALLDDADAAAQRATLGLDSSTTDLGAVARVGVRVNSTGSTHKRRRMNLIAGSNVTITASDDSTDEEVDVTIAASGGGGGGATVSTGALASRPAAGTAGAVYVPTDAPYCYVDTGGAWQAHGPIWKLTEPVDADFSWVNQGGASVSTAHGGVFLNAPATSPDSLRMRVKNAPTPPYTIELAFMPIIYPANFGSAGFVWRESSSGRTVLFNIVYDNGYKMAVTKFNSSTSFSAHYLIPEAFGLRLGPLTWFRSSDDGTNRSCSWMVDGYNPMTLHSVSRTDFLSADQVGFFANSVNVNYPVGIYLLHWREY